MKGGTLHSHVEGEFQSIVEIALTCGSDGQKKLLEVNGTIVVLVEGFEGVPRDHAHEIHCDTVCSAATYLQ